jgi:hypothetical protein
MYTLEISGRAIAVTDGNEGRAHNLFGSEVFRNDLRGLESNGEPLWDGSSPLTVRPASSREQAAFERAMSDSDDRSAVDKRVSVLFLVRLDGIEGWVSRPTRH